MAKYTREKIIDAFFALASENPEKSNFTISEIASKAGISRQAIYQKHFKNFNEIILYVHNLIDKEICQVFNNYNPSSNINPLDYIAENVLPAIWKERQWIRCLYTTNIDPNFEAPHLLYLLTLNGVLQILSLKKDNSISQMKKWFNSLHHSL